MGFFSAQVIEDQVNTFSSEFLWPYDSMKINSTSIRGDGAALKSTWNNVHA